MILNRISSFEIDSILAWWWAPVFMYITEEYVMSNKIKISIYISDHK